jgi:hypothetical protein
MALVAVDHRRRLAHQQLSVARAARAVAQVRHRDRDLGLQALGQRGVHHA